MKNCLSCDIEQTITAREGFQRRIDELEQNLSSNREQPRGISPLFVFS